MNHPLQPTVIDDEGIARFKGNAFVEYLFEKSSMSIADMNLSEFSVEDREQMLQLLGIPVSEFVAMKDIRQSSVEEAQKMIASSQADDAIDMDALLTAHRSFVAAFQAPKAVTASVQEAAKTRTFSPNEKAWGKPQVIYKAAS
jgi:hypothetical protein